MKKLFKIIWFSVLLVAALGLGLSIYCQDVNPNDNQVLPFLGLLFPLFFWTNFVLVIVLFFRKKASLIIPLIALVYAYPSIQNYYQLFAKEEFSKANIDEIKLVSYNVRIFDVNKNIGGNVKDSIFSMLEQKSANIICFQEFYHNENPEIFETTKTVQEDLELPNFHENFTHHIRGGIHTGVATFTSFPVINKGVVEFKSDFNNTCIYTDLQIGNDTVRVYNVHLSSIRFQHEDYSLVQESNESVELSNESIDGYRRIHSLLNKAYKKRALQLQKVLDHIYDSPYPVVLAGDFNDTPISYCYTQTRKYLTDSFVESGSGVGNTYIGEFPSFRIDYVFHSDDMESADYQTLPEKLSDHHAVYTKLRVKPI